MDNMEKRSFTTEVRAQVEDERAVIEGEAALFNVRTEIFPKRFEEIKPGAFDGVLKSADARGLFNHNTDNILGRQSAGTLEMRADSKALYYKIFPPETQAGRDIIVSINRGDVTGSSFSFNVADDGDEFRSIDGGVLRTITKISDLGDVGPVTYPQYETTTASTRSKDAFQAEADRFKAENDMEEGYKEQTAVQVESESRERELLMRG